MAENDDKKLNIAPEGEQGNYNPEQSFIHEQIMDKRRQKWKRRIISFLFVILCAFVFGIVAKYVYNVVAADIFKKLGIDMPYDRDKNVGLISQGDRIIVTPLPDGKATPAPGNSSEPVTGKPTEDVKPEATPEAQGNSNEKDDSVIGQVGTTEGNNGNSESGASGGTAGENGKNPETEAHETGTNDTNENEKTETGEDGDLNLTEDKENSAKHEYSYVAFMNEVKEVADEVSNVVVSIEAVSVTTSWLGDKEVITETTGLVLNQDKVDVLILTDYDSVDDAKTIKVTFEGAENSVKGRLYAFDKDYGIAIIAVKISELGKDFAEKIEFAVSRKVEDMTVATPVFSLGRPNGHKDSFAFGLITGINYSYYVVDGKINYFTTDWTDYGNSNGFVFDMDGFVLGMITHEYKNDESANVTGCIAINALKDEIDLLLKGSSLLKFGIITMDVPENVKAASGVSGGVYVSGFSGISSPAAVAGLKTGDIITQVNGVPVSDVEEFMDFLSAGYSGQAMNVTFRRMYSDGSKENSAYVILSEK